MMRNRSLWRCLAVAILLGGCGAAPPPVQYDGSEFPVSEPEAGGESAPVEGPSPVAVVEGWLGVTLEPVAGAEAAALGFTGELVRVGRVLPSSPAEVSGLEDGDLILEVDGQRLTDVQALVSMVRTAQPGLRVVLTLSRGGVELEQPVLLGLRPEFEELWMDYFTGSPAPEIVANLLEDNSAISPPGDSRVLLLVFWATWCGPCRREIPSLDAIREQHGEDLLRMVAVSSEDPEVLAEFLEGTPMSYDVAYDLNEETKRNYWVTALPTAFIIDGGGVVRAVLIGGDKVEELGEELERLGLEP